MALFHLINLKCDVSKLLKNTFTKSAALWMLHGRLGPTCTHVPLLVKVHLFQKPLLAVGVGGQQVGGEGERAGDDLMASDEEEEGLAHNLVFSQRLGRGSGLVPWGKVHCALGRGQDFFDNVKVLYAHSVCGTSSIQHHLEEVSPPLRTREENTV